MFRRRRPVLTAALAPSGVTLGRRLAGERVLPMDGPSFVLPYEHLRRHAVVLGAVGMGKTETVMRIANEVARGTETPVFMLDAKGDRAGAERFCGLMGDAGREARVFPHQRFDAWRGDWRAIVNRLLEVIEFVPEGPAAYYRDIAKTVLQLACNHPDGPPRSSAELLFRIDAGRLRDAHGETSTVKAVPRDKISQVRMRYEAFFGQVGSVLDGSWAWEDADSAYLLLDSAALGEDASSLASLLFADFAHYFSMRKPREQRALLIADEFASIASSSDVAVKIEQARSFNTGLVLVPQVDSGMGGEEQRARILGSAETVILHSVNEPDELAALAGTKRAVGFTHRYEEGIRGRDGLARLEDRPRIDPNDVRRLAPGTAFVIRRGRAAKVAIDRAPKLSGELPEEESTERAPVTLPGPDEVDLSYLDAEQDPVESGEPDLSYLDDGD
jgi:hypothetical protein